MVGKQEATIGLKECWVRCHEGVLRRLIVIRTDACGNVRLGKGIIWSHFEA
jgi:hypothetical protein